MHKKLKGFTLIELLVVILIIGILATLVIINVSNARKSARDAKRVANLKSIQTALEMYYEKNKEYPSTLSAVAPPVRQWLGYSTGAVNGCGQVLKTDNSWISGLVSGGFIPALPTDPKPTMNTTSPLNGKCYQYMSDTIDYMVKANNSMETCPSTGCGNSESVSIKEMIRPNYPADATIAVYSSGARTW